MVVFRSAALCFGGYGKFLLLPEENGKVSWPLGGTAVPCERAGSKEGRAVRSEVMRRSGRSPRSEEVFAAEDT